MALTNELMYQRLNSDRTALNLNSCDLVDADIPLLSLFLEDHPNITSLDISENQIGAAGATALAGNTTITSLNISENPIVVEWTRALREEDPLKRARFQGGNAPLPSLERPSLFIISQGLREDTITQEQVALLPE